MARLVKKMYRVGHSHRFNIRMEATLPNNTQCRVISTSHKPDTKSQVQRQVTWETQQAS